MISKKTSIYITEKICRFVSDRSFREKVPPTASTNFRLIYVKYDFKWLENFQRLEKLEAVYYRLENLQVLEKLFLIGEIHVLKVTSFSW